MRAIWDSAATDCGAGGMEPQRRTISAGPEARDCALSHPAHQRALARDGMNTEGDKRNLFGQGRPMAKDSSGSGSAWATGTTSQRTGATGYPVESRLMFEGTVSSTDMSRATDAREKDRIGIFGSGLLYAGSYGRVTSESIGRDLNPLGRGAGQALVGGIQQLGNLCPRSVKSQARSGIGNSVNNGCGGTGCGFTGGGSGGNQNSEWTRPINFPGFSPIQPPNLPPPPGWYWHPNERWERLYWCCIDEIYHRIFRGSCCKAIGILVPVIIGGGAGNSGTSQGPLQPAHPQVSSPVGPCACCTNAFSHGEECADFFTGNWFCKWSGASFDTSAWMLCCTWKTGDSQYCDNAMERCAISGFSSCLAILLGLIPGIIFGEKLESLKKAIEYIIEILHGAGHTQEGNVEALIGDAIAIIMLLLGSPLLPYYLVNGFFGCLMCCGAARDSCAEWTSPGCMTDEGEYIDFKEVCAT